MGQYCCNKITREIYYKYIDKLFIIIYYNGVVIIYVLLKGENMTREELIQYIKVICSIAGCDSYYAEKFKCDMYLDCGSCLEDKIIEHDNQVRIEAIEEYKRALLKLIKDEQDTRYGYLNEMDIREVAEQIIKIPLIH